MKKVSLSAPPARRVLMILATALLLAVPLAAEDGDDGTTEGKVVIGGWDASVDDSPDAVSEYQPDDGGVLLKLKLKSLQDGGAIRFGAKVLGEDQQQAGFEFDVGRAVRSETTWTRFLHRLGHDPMTDLEAATPHGRVVYHTDTDPGREYDVSYRLLNHVTEIQPPGLSALTLTLGYRLQERKGVRQVMTVSHCDACHVTAQSRPVDETTEDAKVGAAVTWDGGQLEASFVHRSFDDSLQMITLLFDDALHPENRVPIFDNRLQYDSAEGPQPVDVVPEVSKDIGRFDVRFFDVGGFAITAGGVFSDTENEYTGLKADYTGYMVNAARRFKNGLSLRFRGRAYSISNDDVFVDAVERESIAGPHVGQTYRESFDFDPDFLRRSSLNRDVVESKFDLTYKLGKKAGTLKFLWEWEAIDRENLIVALPGTQPADHPVAVGATSCSGCHEGERKTTTNLVGIGWWTRPAKGWRVSADYRHAEVDNPFMAINGVHSVLFHPDRYSSPFLPGAPQYFDFHAARIGDGTASPSSWDELKLGLTKAFGNNSFSASYKWWDGENTDGDLTDWTKQLQTATVTLWGAPAPKWTWHLAYTRHDKELEIPFNIPIYDG